MHRIPMPWTPLDTGEISTSDAIRTCRQLAHGRWAGDRVGRSAREAGASLQGRSSPERRAASGTRVAAKRVAMVLDVGACFRIFAQVATGMDSKPPATLRGGSACRAMLANNRRRPPLLSGRGALNLGVYLAGMHHLATMLVATCGWRLLPRHRLRACPPLRALPELLPAARRARQAVLRLRLPAHRAGSQRAALLL